MKGKTSGAWTCTWSATAWRSPTAASAPRSRPSSPTTAASSPSTTGAWARPIRRTMRNYYEQRRKEIGAAIARETRAAAALPAAITGSWFENRDHPAGRGHARSAGRRDPGRRLQQGEREAGGGRQAGRPRHRAAPPEPAAANPAASAPAAAGTLHRHRRVRRLPRAGARVLEDDQARARAVGADAHRPRQGPVVRRLPRHRLPAARRPADLRHLARHLPRQRRRCEACHGAGRPTARPSKNKTARDRSAPGAAGPVSRRPAAAAIPPTSPAATSTTSASGPAIVGPGTASWGARGPPPPL